MLHGRLELARHVELVIAGEYHGLDLFLLDGVADALGEVGLQFHRGLPAAH